MPATLASRKSGHNGEVTSTLPPLADILDLVPDAVCVVDPEGRFLFVSSAFTRIFGYAPEEVMGLKSFDLIHPDDRDATVRQAMSVMAGTDQRHFRNRYIHKRGHVVDIQWSARWLPEYGVRIAIAHDVSELRRVERELERRASQDELTGLANRHRLEEELREAIARARRDDTVLALLYIDLDGFKGVNDRGGHAVGDKLLQEVSTRMQQGLRHGDLVARVGGDEFIALLQGCRDVEAARTIAADLRERAQRLYSMPDGVYQLQASIGIACYPANGTSAAALIDHADRAMYADKRRNAASRRLSG